MTNNQMKTSFSKRVRELRTSHGMTQEQLGKKANLTADWISHFEAGRRVPSLFTLVRLMDALEVNEIREIL